MGNRSPLAQHLIYAVAFVLPISGSAALAATEARWLGATNGNWTTPARWSTGVVPHNTAVTNYAATVDVAGAPYIVTLGQNAQVAVDSLAINSPDATVYAYGAILTTSHINVNAGRFRQVYSTLRNATLTASGSGAFDFTDDQTWENVRLGSGFKIAYTINGAPLDEVSAIGGLVLDNAAFTMQHAGTFRFAGGGLSGSGEITVVNRPASSGYETTFTSNDPLWTVGSGITVRSAAGSDGRGGDVEFRGTWENHGLLSCEVATGNVRVGGQWTNRGTLRVSAGSLWLGGAFKTSDIGTLQATGGRVVISGTLDNRNAVLRANLGAAEWRTARESGLPTIIGGRIECSTTKPLLATYETNLNNVTLAGKFRATDSLHIQGGRLTFDAGELMLAHGTELHSLRVAQASQLVGTGFVTFDGTGGRVRIFSGLSLTVDEGVTFRAAPGAAGWIEGDVTINGPITSTDAHTGTVGLLGGVTLNGTARANNGGTFQIGTWGIAAGNEPIINGTVTAEPRGAVAYYGARGNGRYEIEGTLLAGKRADNWYEIGATNLHATISNIDLAPGSEVELDWAPGSLGPTHDVLHIAHAVQLGGFVEIRGAGFRDDLPYPGTRLRVLTIPDDAPGAFAGVRHTWTWRPGLRITMERIELDGPADALEVLFAATAGDANLNGRVNFDDLLILAQNYGATFGKGWLQGDFNQDAAVNFQDLLLMVQNYERSGVIESTSHLQASFLQDFYLATRLAPEPAVLSLAVCWPRRRVRR